MREIIQNIETHYTGNSLESCLGNAIKRFEMGAFDYREEGHRHIYFLRKFEEAK